MTRLRRSSAQLGPAAPVRAVHLGLGGFHRAHQAWYTAADPDWGIAAYTFRNTELPRALNEQEGLYTLLTHGEPETTAEIVSTISRAHPGSDTQQWIADVSDPDIALITLTVTESAYQVPAPGEDSALTRLVAGLEQRFRANEAPLTLVPCDNVPDNGAVLRSALNETAARVNPRLAEWIDGNISVASTVVDRITPARAEADVQAATELTGLHDLVPVVTEPFTEWLIAGEFPLGRPAWERAGARFVDRVDTYQERKLWFLNGAHTLLAYVGLATGHATVRDAVLDSGLAKLVDSWWETASRHSALPAEHLTDYRERLLARFASPGIRHQLQQIAMDGSQKIPARILPVLRAERAQDRLPGSAVIGLAAWVAHLRAGEVRDPRATEFVALARAARPAGAVLSALDPELGEDGELVAAVESELASFTATSR